MENTQNTSCSLSADNFWAIIPAGGVGSRLWPLSRAAAPKFLHDLTGVGASLLQSTWTRLAGIAGASQTVLVTGASHAAAVTAQLPELLPANLLAEPAPRDSSAAIGLAAALIEARDPEAIVGSFAADHVVTDAAAFNAAVAAAVKTAAAGHIVTIGITPTHPSTGFGYIKTSGAFAAQDDAPQAVAVERFVEKPDEETASAYFAEGCWLWNGGMFISRASVLLDQMALAEPEMVAALRDVVKHFGTPSWETELDRIWGDLPKIAIDYTVAEPAAAAGQMMCVPAAFGWDDIGDFASIATLMGDGEGLVTLGDDARIIAEKTTGIIVPDKRIIATYGLKNIVIVDTPDALLVTTTEHAQKVKNLVARATELDPTVA